MKELKTEKPMVIALIGLPGAGKSTFAESFSTMFGAPTVGPGAIQRTIFGTKMPTREQHDGIVQAVWLLTSELLKSKRMFLLDGLGNGFAERSEIRAQAKKAGYNVLFVWVQTSEPVALGRALKPRKDATNVPCTETAFTKAVKSFEPPRATEEHVVVSGQRTLTSQVRPILKKIAERHESTLTPPPERPPRRNIFIR